MNRSIFRIWKSQSSLEIFTMDINGSGIIAGGYIKRSYQFNLKYTIHLDHRYLLKDILIVNLETNLSMSFHRDPYMRWFDGRGIHISLLDSCETIDISATPFTNSLALLGRGGEEHRMLKVVYFNCEDFTVEPRRQIYTRLDETHYRYESPESGYMNEIEFDDFLLVENYPGLFKCIHAFEHPEKIYNGIVRNA